MNPSRLAPSLALSMAAGLAVLAAFAAGVLAASEGRLELTTIDKDTGKPIACRMHLKNAAGRPKLVRESPAWDDHFIVPGRLALKLPLGNYTFEIERGPEYKTLSGYFTINRFADDSKQVELPRGIDMAANGWWSGDLDVRRRPRDMRVLMDAEDLHVVPLVTWWTGGSEWTASAPPKEVLARFEENRYCHWMAGEQTRPGGTLLYFNLPRPMKLGDPGDEFPPTLRYVEAARKHPGAWIDMSRPFGWDLPMLVAHGQVDSIQVAHGQICRSKLISTEEGGKGRDVKRYPGPSGTAKWSQEIYFRLLDCGLRVPPSAGSGSGVSPNPVGYNRVYVHVDGELTCAKWWENFRAGRVTITNGPLLQPTVRGQLPGHVFQERKGRPVEFEIGLTISLREPINYLEIIKNGRVEQEIRFDEYAKTGRLPKLRFDQSGWFLIRAVTDQPKTYRFGMTGPYYVEMDYERRISKRSAEFFLDWVLERARQIRLEDPDQRRQVLECHRKARDFWRDLVSRANAE